MKKELWLTVSPSVTRKIGTIFNGLNDIFKEIFR